MRELLHKTMEKSDRLKHSCVATAILCFVTHAFTYYNASFIHDRCILNFSVTFDSAMRTKWMDQYLDLLTGFAYLPWLTGILTIFFFMISIYLLVDILEIRYVVSVWLIAGVCITQSSVVNAHMYWPHEILAALPFAVISAWIWKNEKIGRIVRVVAGAFLWDYLWRVMGHIPMRLFALL